MIKKQRKQELKMMIQEGLENISFSKVFDEDFEEMEYLNNK